jgi:hypothetical protein
MTWQRVGPRDVEYIGSRGPAYDEQLVRAGVTCGVLLSNEPIDDGVSVARVPDICGCDVNGLSIVIEGVAHCWAHVPYAVKVEVVEKYGKRWSSHPAAERFNLARREGRFGDEMRMLAPDAEPPIREGRADDVLRPAPILGERGYAGRLVENRGVREAN